MSTNNYNICGFRLLEPIGVDTIGTVFSALYASSPNSTTVKLVGHFINDTSSKKILFHEYIPSNHEIIISEPPCEANLEESSHRQFPVLINGKIKFISLFPYVRKPGYWATTSIRVALSAIEKHPKQALNILDLGCGSGIIGISLSKHPKVRQVFFADIEENAVNCTIENANSNSIDNFSAMCGDLFEPFKNNEKFDLIIFGPPFYPNGIGIPKTSADVDGSSGNELAIKFSNEVRNYLELHGISIVYMADYVDYESVNSNLRKNGLSTRLEKRDILYPLTPLWGFPKANEIKYRQKLELFFNYTFYEQEFRNRSFIGFKMVHLISYKQEEA